MGGGGVYAVYATAAPVGVPFGYERLIVSRRLICGALALFVRVCETPCHDASRGNYRLSGATRQA